jgi:hypothetical protein
MFVEDIELKIAGNQYERSLMMPLLYIEDEETKTQIARDITQLLETYTRGNPATKEAPAPRMKPLDVVKVLMGIRSERDSVKQFMYDGKWFASYQEFDYEQLTAVADDVVRQWYIENIQVLEGTLKKRKIEVAVAQKDEEPAQE